MIISTRGRYALRVMIDLSQQDPESYTPLKEIAARQEISEKYLENILKSLVTQGFILGLRGKGGGYRLTKSPEEYSRFHSSCDRRKSCGSSMFGGSCTGMCTCWSMSDTSDLGKAG